MTQKNRALPPPDSATSGLEAGSPGDSGRNSSASLWKGSSIQGYHWQQLSYAQNCYWDIMRWGIGTGGLAGNPLDRIRFPKTKDNGACRQVWMKRGESCRGHNQQISLCCLCRYNRPHNFSADYNQTFAMFVFNLTYCFPSAIPVSFSGLSGP